MDTTETKPRRPGKYTPRAEMIAHIRDSVDENQTTDLRNLSRAKSEPSYPGK
jgi:hypothetical protein